jgi:prefoldin subunit 5
MHMMRFAAMTLEEEIEFLEAVKERLEERLSSVNARLQKLKA